MSGISEGWFNCPALSDGKFFRFTGDFGDETVALQFRNEDSLLRHVYIRRGDFIALLVVVDIDDEALLEMAEIADRKLHDFLE